MIKGVNLCVMLAASIFMTTLSQDTPPSTTRNIYKSPEDSDITEIEDSNMPWVLPEFIPIIEEYKTNLFAGLDASPQIQSIWDFETDSETTRDIFFRLFNKFLSDIDHPAAAHLANVVSKAGSLFDPITMPIMFETDAIHLCEFLLAHNIEIDSSTPQGYVDAMSAAIDKADINDPDSLWQAFLDGYANFVESFGFKLEDIIDELVEDLTSQLIIIYDNANGL